MTRTNQGYTLVELLTLLIVVGFGGAVLYVLAHFIAKFW